MMRFFSRLCLLLLVLALAGAGAVGWWLNQALPLGAARVEVSIEPGTPPREVAEAWVRAGVQTSPGWLYQWFRWSGQSRKIRAGSYEIEPGITPRGLLAKMVRGDQTLEQVRFIEGWTLTQLRAALAQAPGLRHQSADMTEAQLMAALGAEGTPAEGRFFPDTYAYSRGVSDLTVLKRAHAALEKRLAQAWAQRDPSLVLKSPADLLTLASIVEKETGAAADRALVAGVFSNRLRIGMPLQTDPTVIYGLGNAYDGRLHKQDLLTDTPYNTYTRSGLPPTPIALVGQASLDAARQPAPTKALYFVAKGDGSSAFSETLDEHNRAVNRYIRGK